MLATSGEGKQVNIQSTGFFLLRNWVWGVSLFVFVFSSKETKQHAPSAAKLFQIELLSAMF